MPKKIFSKFFHNISNDIKLNYNQGDRYLSVKQISEKFGVSVQTAQKGVKELVKQEVLVSKQKSGIYILKNEIEPLTLSDTKKLVVLSRIDNPLFYQPFYDGILERAANSTVSVSLVVNTYKDISSLSFGEFLVGLNANGIITLNFDRSSALPFYHAIREGIDLASDIIIDELPLLPSVQTDNYRHSFQAGRLMVNQGIEIFYAFGSYPETNKRFIGFRDGVKKHADKVKYVQTSEVDSINNALRIINNIKNDTGIFLCDYTAVHYIASLCSRFHIQFPVNHVIAYDGEANEFHYPGIPVIPCVGPSFHKIGYELCDTILKKWETGIVTNPVHRKI